MKDKHHDRGKGKQLRDKDLKSSSRDKVSTAWENLDQKLSERLDHLDSRLGRGKSQDRGDRKSKK